MTEPHVEVDPEASGLVLPRHPGDAVRVVIAVAIIVVTAMLVHRDRVAVLEVDAFRLANDLPAWLFPLLWPVMQTGNLLAVPVVALVVVLTRRFRLAAEILVAGTGVWLVAKFVKDMIVRDRPTALLEGVHVHGAQAAGHGYLSGHASVAAAMATLIIPYLGRRARRVAVACLVLVGVARMYVGAHLPLDVIAGAALGWGVASAVHLLLGAPSGRPRTSDVAAALGGLDLSPARMRALGLDTRRSARYDVTLDDGRRLFVKVIPRERRDRDLLYRMWRFARRRGRSDEPSRNGQDELEHEALMAVLAARAGARVAPVVAFGGYRHGAGVLAYGWVDGRPLGSDPHPAAAVLHDAWRNLDALHRAGVVHRDLCAGDLLVDDGGLVHLVGLGGARVAGSDGNDERLADAADLLALTADACGAARALDVAADHLVPHELGRVLALLATDRRYRARRDAGRDEAGDVAELVELGRQKYSSAAPKVDGGRRQTHARKRPAPK